jgi:hypothetical protein
MKAVTEQDLRAPEFKEGTPEDYEFRADGKIVRKDRWEKGIRDIVGALGMVRDEFEIEDVVTKVRVMVQNTGPEQQEAVKACKAVYDDFSVDEVSRQNQSIKRVWIAGKAIEEVNRAKG